MEEGPFIDLDLRMIIFSDEAWIQLIACLKQSPHKVTELSVSSVTIKQLRILFESPEILESVKRLNLDSDGVRASPEGKTKLASLLDEHLPKLKNLNYLSLNNRLLQNEQIGFLNNLPEVEIEMKNHWIKGDPRFPCVEPEIHMALLCNTEYDKETLNLCWEEQLPQSHEFAFGNSSQNLLNTILIDSPTS